MAGEPVVKLDLMQTSFNGGELSPYVAGRVDVAKYANGCARMENFIPLIQGPAVTRPGLRYVAEVKTSANRTWLVRFEFSATEAYMLEFGDQYIRFYTNRAQALSSGSPYEIASPYTAASLTNSDGTFALRYAQTGDVIYLVHGSYAVRKLQRLAATNWTLSVVDFDEPPFAEENDTATTIYASAETGSVTLTASANLFAASDVGRYLLLEQPTTSAIERWEAGKALVVEGGSPNNPVGLIRRAGANVYKCTTDRTIGSGEKEFRTGTITPTHTEGIEMDGDGGEIQQAGTLYAKVAGLSWEYLHSGYGIAKITAYTNATTVTATVTSRMPGKVVGSGNPTAKWAWGAWDDAAGHPTAVGFFRERLVFARSATLWFSVVGDFENFATKIGGVVTADAGFDRTIASDRVNAIRWMSPGTVLLVGTLGDEWAIAEQNNGQAFGPANAQTKRQSAYGSSNTDAVRVGDVTLFVQRSNRKLRAMSFQFEQDKFSSDDLAAFAEHVPTRGLVDIAYQSEPWQTVWGARSDGVLVGLTLNQEQAVVAWHRHPVTGSVVECVETIPAPSGMRDDLWCIVRITVGGTTKRYVCYLADEPDEDTAQVDWFQLDLGATYSGAPATTISGLGYLEGKEVWVLADGAAHPNRTVNSGAIELQQAASKVQVGLPMPAYLRGMPLTGGPQSEGKTKRVHQVTVRLLNSLGGRAGPDEAHLRELRYRLPAVPMGSAPPAFSGDVTIDWDGNYAGQQAVLVVRDKPMPMTVVATMPELYANAR